MNDASQLETVVTEELRGRSRQGRELVEGEEAVALVDMVEASERNAFRFEGVRDFRTPPERASSPVSARILANALNTERNLQASQQLMEDLEITRARAADRAANRPVGQPSVQEFLSRPYHEVKRNRFLFCEENENESYSNNRASGWDDSIALAHVAAEQRSRQNGLCVGVARWTAGDRGDNATAVPCPLGAAGAASSSGAAGSSETHGAGAPGGAHLPGGGKSPGV